MIQAKDHFLQVPFAVLGLGDSNYDKFCLMGKSIDRRIGELGGARLIDLQCADEAVGLEETVEKWKSAVFRALLQLKPAQEAVDSSVDTSATLPSEVR